MGKARLRDNSDDRLRPSPPSGSRRVRALAAAPRTRTAWGLGGLGFILFASTLANPLAQTSGCARCGAAPPTPTYGLAAPFAGFSPFSRVQIPRRQSRLEWTRRREAGGGSYTVCVRSCDGGFFPVTYFGAASRTDSLEEVCQSLCPNAEVRLYSFPFGGTIDEAVSSTGEPYDSLPNAHKFEQSWDSSCSCRRPRQSWADALAKAEAKYGHNARDILVTAEKSAEMSRPIEDPRTMSARPSVMKTNVVTAADGSGPAPLDLDINGVDTKLGAAAASMSRETAGIREEDVQRHSIYRLNQGRTVEEKDPDGSLRRVRIVGPTF